MTRDLQIKTEKVAKRFWNKIKKSDGCWEWIGQKYRGMYPRFCLNGKDVMANRVMFFNYIGPISDDAIIYHHCGTAACINPSHFSLETIGPNATGLRFPSERIAKRFWRTVSKGDGCWEWTGYKHRDFYGEFCLNGKMVKAHRVAYENLVGPIPSGLLVCHRCDNPICVRPDHLFLGTHLDNNHDMISKGRGRVQRGSQHAMAKLTENNIKEIRQYLHSREYSQTQIAKLFGVCKQSITLIAQRKRWKHVV